MNAHCRIGRVKPKGNISLFPGTMAPELPVNAQPRDDVIKTIEDVLTAAKAGKVQAIAFAWADDQLWPFSDYAFGAGQMPLAIITGALHRVLWSLEDEARIARLVKPTGDKSS